MAEGSHSIAVRAYDAAGKSTVDDDTTVHVDQAVLALDETFSDRDGDGDYFDGTDWRGQFSAAADNATESPAGSQSAHGYASSGTNCATGTATRTLSREITLGDAPRLTYKRKLDLYAAVNTGTTAAFRVQVNGTEVDGSSVTYDSYAEPDWRRREVDLSAYANATVTLTFEVSAYSNVCMEVYAKAWVDDIRVGNPQEDADTTAPSVDITATSDGASVSGSVDIEASAAGLSAINKTGTTQLKLRFAELQSSTNYLFIENGSFATLHVEYE